MAPGEKVSLRKPSKETRLGSRPCYGLVASQNNSNKSSDDWRSIAQAARDTVLSIDPEGTILSANRALGPHAVEKTIATSCFDYVAPQYHDALRNAIQQAIDTGGSCSCEFAGPGPDGQTSQYCSRLLPVKQDGELIVLTMIVTNVAARQELEHLLEKSETCWCKVLDSVPIAIGLGTIEGKVLYANDAILKLTGYSRQEIQHVDLKDVYADREMRLNILKRLREDGYVRDCEVRLRSKDGTLYWARLNTIPLSLKGEEALLTTMGDITELTQARQQADTLLAAVEQSDDGIVVGDLDGKIVYANRAFAEMHGYAPEEVLGIAALHLHPPKLKDEHKRRVRQIRERGSWKGEMSHMRKDGTVFPIYVSASLCKNDEEENGGLVAVIRNITEAKQIQKDLREHRAKMVQLERHASLGICSAMLSHQLNEPLTVVRLALEDSLESLQFVSCPEAITQQLEAALRGTSKLASIAKQVKGFARHGVPRARSKVDLNAVANQIARLFEELARQAKTTLHLQGFDLLEPVYLKGDIEQLFFALMENAIQAADGKHSHQVTISGAMWDTHVELRFTDDCGGITREDQKRLFEPFFTTKPSRGGTGLGLPVAQYIVSQDGGDIRVESAPGKGSTFIVRLPINGTLTDGTEKCKAM